MTPFSSKSEPGIEVHVRGCLHQLRLDYVANFAFTAASFSFNFSLLTTDLSSHIEQPRPNSMPVGRVADTEDAGLGG